MSYRTAVTLCLALALLSLVFGRPHHPHFWWDALPPVWALIGYAGAWLLVVGAKTLAARWLERPEAADDDR
jgi:hypothetical protein